MKRILVVGSINMDTVVNVDHHPKTGETILGRNIEYFHGGKGENQAYAIANLSGNVSMLSVVGNDEAGISLLENLDRVGVVVSRINIRKDVHSGTAFISINKEGNNFIIVSPGANDKCDIAYIKNTEDIFEDIDYLLIQMEIPLETLNFVVDKAHSMGKIVILNPAPAQKISDEILSKIQYLTPNETELEILTEMSCNTLDEIKEASKYLIEKGLANVVITLGEKGAIVLNNKEAKIVPGRFVKAVDTTAAGDCFNGAFTIGLSEGLSVEDAILFANKAASISVTRKGAQSSMPNRSEVELY